MKLLQIIIRGLFLSLFIFGCDSDASDSDTSIQDPIVPCGGDVVGKWNMTDAYIPGIDTMLTDRAPACQDALTNQSTSVTGTMTFTANGTSNINGTLSQSVSMVLTEQCLQDIIPGQILTASSTTCNAIALLISGTAGSPFDAAACTYSGTACDCSAQATTAIITNGPYTLPGNNTIVDQDGVASPYCVDGDTMFIEATADAGATVNLKLTR